MTLKKLYEINTDKVEYRYIDITEYDELKSRDPEFRIFVIVIFLNAAVQVQS